MKIRRALVFAYSNLLRLYPAALGQRFAAEMLEIAESADLSEWPLIFTDTTVAIVRSWLETPLSRGTGSDPYLPLEQLPMKPWKLVQGFALAATLVLWTCYVSTQNVWKLPSCHTDGSCASISSETVRR
jgi:hypothetical protein